jgi:hypothetical protein
MGGTDRFRLGSVPPYESAADLTQVSQILVRATAYGSKFRLDEPNEDLQHSGHILVKDLKSLLGLTSGAGARLGLGGGIAQQHGSDHDQEQRSKHSEQVVHQAMRT